MGPMMSDARSGRLLLQPSVVFPPPRLGHPPFFKARPWWGPPHPSNFMPPPGPPVGMNHGPPPHNSVHGNQHQHDSNYPQSQSSENSSGGPASLGGSGGPQNLSSISSGPPSHSYSAFRNNMRTNPPPMSYSAKRMQQTHTQHHSSTEQEPSSENPSNLSQENQEDGEASIFGGSTAGEEEPSVKSS